MRTFCFRKNISYANSAVNINFYLELIVTEGILVLIYSNLSKLNTGNVKMGKGSKRVDKNTCRFCLIGVQITLILCKIL